MSMTVEAKKDRTKQAVTNEPGLTVRDKGLVVAFAGRGKMGKTVEARFLTERALRASRAVMPCDGDRYNQTLTAFFPNAFRPPSADPVVVARWLQEMAAWAAEHRWAIALDLGGNDRDYLRQGATIATGGVAPLPVVAEGDDDDLAAWGLGDISDLTGSGVDVTQIYALGDDLDDTRGLDLLRERGLVGHRTILLLNEGRLRKGPPAGLVDEEGKPLDGEDPFAEILNDPPVVKAVSLGARTLRMPELDADVAAWLDRYRTGYGDAVKGVAPDGGKPLDALGRQRLLAWMRLMERRHKPFAGLLP